MITQLLNKNNTKKENVHKNHRKRLRAELRHMNFQVVEDYKILEFILFYTNAQKDTNPIAHNLINTFGNFANGAFGNGIWYHYFLYDDQIP